MLVFALSSFFSLLQKFGNKINVQGQYDELEMKVFYLSNFFLQNKNIEFGLLEITANSRISASKTSFETSSGIIYRLFKYSQIFYFIQEARPRQYPIEPQASRLFQSKRSLTKEKCFPIQIFSKNQSYCHRIDGVKQSTHQKFKTI